MRNLEKEIMYKIPLHGLKVGTHEYDYELDNQFFNEFDYTEGTEGEIEAKVILIKSELLLSLKINLKGYVVAVCDRCLDNLDLPVEGETEFFVKYSDEEEELADNLLVIPTDSDFIDLRESFYELYLLNVPLKAVHPDVDGKSTCNERMLEKLDDYSVDPEDKIDPRWAELKKLINK